MNNSLAKNKASREIEKRWAYLPPQSQNRGIAETMIYIIDNCLACGKTADWIASQFIKINETEMPKTAKEIIFELKESAYFRPDHKIKEILAKIS